MKVSALIASLRGGGAERVMAWLCSELVARGHQVRLITLEGSDSDVYPLPTSVERVCLIQPPAGSAIGAALGYFRRILRVRRALLAPQPDIVLSFMDEVNIIALLSLLGSSVPVVVSERIDPRHYRIASWKNRLRPWLYKNRAAVVVVQTDGIADWAREFLPPEKICVIPNAAKTGSSTAADQSDPTWPASVPAPTPTTLVAMGRLHRQKGFDLLMEAWRELAPRFPQWNLAIFGEGAERANLERQAANVPRVALLGWLDNPGAYLERCGAFVFPSRFEGFPNALVEAMASGLPCVATDCPTGPADIIEHGKNGLLVPVDSVAALSAALDQVLADPQLRQTLGQQARKVRETLNPEHVFQMWLHALAKRNA